MGEGDSERRSTTTTTNNNRRVRQISAKRRQVEYTSARKQHSRLTDAHSVRVEVIGIQAEVIRECLYLCAPEGSKQQGQEERGKVGHRFRRRECSLGT